MSGQKGFQTPWNVWRTWHYLTLLDTAWHYLTLLDTAWHCLTLLDTTWHCLTLLDTAWHCLTLLDITWHIWVCKVCKTGQVDPCLKHCYARATARRQRGARNLGWNITLEMFRDFQVSQLRVPMPFAGQIRNALEDIKVWWLRDRRCVSTVFL